MDISAHNLMTHIPVLRSRIVVDVFDFRDLILFLDDLSFSPVCVQVFQLISFINVCRILYCIVLYCGRVPAANAPGCTAAEGLL